MNYLQLTIVSFTRGQSQKLTIYLKMSLTFQLCKFVKYIQYVTSLISEFIQYQYVICLISAFLQNIQYVISLILELVKYLQCVISPISEHVHYLEYIISLNSEFVQQPQYVTSLISNISTITNMSQQIFCFNESVNFIHRLKIYISVLVSTQLTVYKGFPHKLLRACFIFIFRVKPTATDGIGGSYMPGSPDGSRPAIFYVNTFHPDERYIVAKQYFLLLLANGLNILEIPFVYFDISQKIFWEYLQRPNKLFCILKSNIIITIRQTQRMMYENP